MFLEGTAFEDEDWNNLYDVFLGPDELHTIHGGLFGTHFYDILRLGGQTPTLEYSHVQF
jgi:hypothetical protein